MFQRIGSAAYKADLDNTIAICKILGNPEHKLKCIHVAGTNGKGSTSHMLASVLQKAGYKTGLYTSPHLKDFRERIKINGKEISKKYIVDFVGKYKAGFENIEPSFFEWTVGLAFKYFADKKVDIAIIEVGLGGRLDSTNVVTPIVSVITNIGYDHINILGNSLGEIAGEKAGIIKPKIPVIISESQKEISDIFKEKAKSLSAPIFFADKLISSEITVLKSFGFKATFTNKTSKTIYKLSPQLSGTYQLKNIGGVLTTLNFIKEAGYNISDKQIIEGINTAAETTGLKGRWQLLKTKPYIVCDTGHNEDGIKAILKNLKRIKYKHLHIVLGMVSDKDISKILKLLPESAAYYFCKANIPRALEAEILQKEAIKYNLKGETYKSVKSALKAAETQADRADLIFIGGSTFTVAEVI